MKQGNKLKVFISSRANILIFYGKEISLNYYPRIIWFYAYAKRFQFFF